MGGILVALGLGLVVLLVIIGFAVLRTPHKAAICSPVQSDPNLRRIAQYFDQGQFGTAIALSDHVLTQKGGSTLCGSTRSQIAVYWYEASSLTLLSKPRPEAGVLVSPLALHQVALDWQHIEKQGNTYGVSPTLRVPARTVATMAGNEGQYELSVTAFRQAWISGTIGPGNLQDIGRYVQYLTAWGTSLVSPSFPLTRSQGVEVLATANSIATAYGLADNRACLALQRIGYSDCTRVTPDVSDPVLAASGK